MNRQTLVASIAVVAATITFTLCQHTTLAAVFSRGSASFGTPTITISGPVELVPPLGACCSQAWAVNSVGHVAGFSASGLDAYAILWTTPGTPFNIGSLGTNFSAAYGISDGPVEYLVGVSRTSTPEDHAYRWDAVNGMIDLGTLGGDLSVAFGVNEVGAVVGRSLTRGKQNHAFLWTPTVPGGTTGVMTDLRTLAGGKFSEARALKNGRIVGWSTTGAGGERAVLWTGRGGPTALDQLPGWFGSRGHAINSLGWVAGMAQTSGGAYAGEPHPVLWTAPNQPLDLGTLPNIGDSFSPLSAAWGINDDGWVVGAVGGGGSSAAYHAFIWTAQDGMIELPAFPGEGTAVAFGINGSQVVGMSGARAVMWTVTPATP